MVRCGNLSNVFCVIVVDVTFIFQHIDDRFIRVIEVASMSPSFASVNLDLDFCDSFKSFSPGHDYCDLSNPVHITSRLIEVSSPA